MEIAIRIQSQTSIFGSLVQGVDNMYQGSPRQLMEIVILCFSCIAIVGGHPVKIRLEDKQEGQMKLPAN